MAYYSHKLLQREQKYATVEKESLAIKMSTQFIRVDLLGRLFVIQTDHRSLQWLDNNPRLGRWSANYHSNRTSSLYNIRLERTILMQTLYLELFDSVQTQEGKRSVKD